jgi:hypothetical protein
MRCENPAEKNIFFPAEQNPLSMLCSLKED